MYSMGRRSFRQGFKFLDIYCNMILGLFFSDVPGQAVLLWRVRMNRNTFCQLVNLVGNPVIFSNSQLYNVLVMPSHEKIHYRKCIGQNASSFCH